MPVMHTMLPVGKKIGLAMPPAVTIAAVAVAAAAVATMAHSPKKTPEA